jgi:hypothetical protein
VCVCVLSMHHVRIPSVVLKERRKPLRYWTAVKAYDLLEPH